MAITKKMVREAKRDVIQRIKALMQMDDVSLRVEIARAWPQILEATRSDQLQFLIIDYIDRSFPDHLID